MSDETAISIQGLFKSYENGPNVLRDISLEARKGELMAILGPSGCGKSTFLRLVADLIKPTSGDIQRFGQSSKPAFIFQDPTLLPWATATENVALPLQLQGKEKAERQELARYWLERLGLKDQSQAYPRELSGGMRMRVSIARALVTQPSLLLLDEPFAALDALSRNHLNEMLVDLHQAHQWTAFFVTHSVSEAVFLAHRIAIFSNAGTLVKLISNPLPCPRKASLREVPEYHALVAQITALLQRSIPDASI